MPSASARKGNTYESSCLLPYLRDQFGPQVTRPRAGGIHDRGDFAGIPDWTFEAKCYGDTLRAIRNGLADLVLEQAHAGTRYGGVIVKRVGVTDPARQLFVMELGAAVPVIRETAAWAPQLPGPRNS